MKDPDLRWNAVLDSNLVNSLWYAHDPLARCTALHLGPVTESVGRWVAESETWKCLSVFILGLLNFSCNIPSVLDFYTMFLFFSSELLQIILYSIPKHEEYFHVSPCKPMLVHVSTLFASYLSLIWLLLLLFCFYWYIHLIVKGAHIRKVNY